MMKSYSQIIGENIKMYRKAKGLTQPKLGELIGKSESTIRKYEAGAVEPSFNILSVISEALGVEVEDLATRTYSSEEEAENAACENFLMPKSKNWMIIFQVYTSYLNTLLKVIYLRINSK